MDLAIIFCPSSVLLLINSSKSNLILNVSVLYICVLPNAESKHIILSCTYKGLFKGKKASYLGCTQVIPVSYTHLTLPTTERV